MNQPPNAVREEHIDLTRFDQGSHFAGAPDRMTHSLTSAIGTRAVIRFTIHRLRATLSELGSIREGTTSATLGTGDSRDESSLRNRSDDVATFFLAHRTQLFNPIADRLSLLFNNLLGSGCLFYSLLFHKYLLSE
jgi:hypothetical protein